MFSDRDSLLNERQTNLLTNVHSVIILVMYHDLHFAVPRLLILHSIPFDSSFSEDAPISTNA